MNIIPLTLEAPRDLYQWLGLAPYLEEVIQQPCLLSSSTPGKRPTWNLKMDDDFPLQPSILQGVSLIRKENIRSISWEVKVKARNDHFDLWFRVAQ